LRRRRCRLSRSSPLLFGKYFCDSAPLQWWPGVWSERDLVADFVGVSFALAALVAAEAARWPPLLAPQAAAKRESMV
jgi:hypothetical protein